MDELVVTDAESLGDGNTRYDVRVDARLRTEFSSPIREDEPPDPVTTFDSSIVLDADLNLTEDERGRIRCRPGPPLHPRFWPEHSERDDWDDPLPGAFDREFKEELTCRYNPFVWPPAEGDAELEAALSRSLEQRGEALVVPRRGEPSAEEFEARMETASATLELDHEYSISRGALGVKGAVFTVEAE